MAERGEDSDDAAAEATSDAEDVRDRFLVGRTETSELARVLQLVEFPLIVHDEEGLIQLANQAAADLVGLDLEEIVGTPVSRFVSPVSLVEGDVADLVAGRFEGFTAARTITPGHGDPIPVYAVAYAIEVDGQRLGVGVSIPQSELGRLGRHPLKRSLELVPVAVGLAGEDWTVISISAEVLELIGRLPADCIGIRLTEMVHSDDAAELEARYGRTPAAPFVLQRVRFATSLDRWIPVSVLVAPTARDAARIRFALVGAIDQSFPWTEDHERDLELRLRRIGADLRAAGVVDSMADVPALEDHRRMGGLTSRQWEILSRLLRGERVPTIARALFISPSTVRNHLSNIFEAFGVHSQIELIELFRYDDR